MRLNPAYPPWYLYVLGQAYRLTGRYTEAIPVFKAYRDLNPNVPFPYIHLAATYSLMGQEAEARAAINEALRREPTYSLKQAAKAYPYKSPDVLDRELEALRKAGLK
jgi:adenylate cyclase